MRALVLEPDLKLNLRDIEVPSSVGPGDVRIKLHTVGICGSDVHYATHGRIGPFVVDAPMILGHEAAGIVVETGRNVRHLRVGDRVCMEPGIPEPGSRASREGMYNLDPGVRFWATPPVHGVLRPEVVHPSEFTFRLPDNVSFGEGAMVEPLAVGMHAATKARIKPGGVALIIGAGPIGMVTALSALAGGCALVLVADRVAAKLSLAEKLGRVVPVDVTKQDLLDVVRRETDGWGLDTIFECSGSPRVAASIFEPLCPGGSVVWVGMPAQPVAFDVVAAQVKEARIETIFRYAHVYPRALQLMGSEMIDLKPLITETFEFEQSVQAFEFAKAMPAGSIKSQIKLPL